MYNLINRILYNIFVIFIAVCLNNLKYPFLSEQYYNYNLYGNSHHIFNIFSHGIRPFVTANMIIGVISNLSSYFNNLQKHSEKKKYYQSIYVITIMMISILFSFIYYQQYLRSFIDNNYKNWFFFVYANINLATSMFVAWITRRIIIDGAANGISLLLSIGIIETILTKSNINSVFDIFYLYWNNCLSFTLLSLVLIIFEDIHVVLKLIALTSIKKHVLDESKEGEMRYTPIQSNSIAYILTSNLQYNLHSVNDYIKNMNFVFINNTFVKQISEDLGSFFTVTNLAIRMSWFYLSLFIFNYGYNTIYRYNIDQMISNVHNRMCYMQDIRIIEIKKYMQYAAIQSSLLSVLFSAILMTVEYVIKKYITGNLIEVTAIELMILLSCFVYFKEFVYRLNIFYNYNLDDDYMVYKQN